MGEPLYGYQAPTGYSDAAETWVNTGGLLERMNFGISLAGNRIAGTKVDLAPIVKENGDKRKTGRRIVKTDSGGRRLPQPGKLC